MNTKWSDSIQTSNILYQTRASRFNQYNSKQWFDLIGVTNGMKVLEVGAGPGHFCIMIKQFFPQCEVSGIDLDSNHILFAKQKAMQLGLQIEFCEADIASLPFDSNCFDLVFSHTVIEHLPIDIFLAEQVRVLKTGGTLVALTVESKLQACNLLFETSARLEELTTQLYSKKVQDDTLGKQSATMQQKVSGFEKYLGNVKFDIQNLLWYCPNNYPEDKGFVTSQINSFYTAEFDSGFMQQEQHGCLNQAQWQEWKSLVRAKYDERINKLNSNISCYDYMTTCISKVNGTKLKI